MEGAGQAEGTEAVIGAVVGMGKFVRGHGEAQKGACLMVDGVAETEGQARAKSPAHN